jgi:hypothetical protein
MFIYVRQFRKESGKLFPIAYKIDGNCTKKKARIVAKKVLKDILLLGVSDMFKVDHATPQQVLKDNSLKVVLEDLTKSVMAGAYRNATFKGGFVFGTQGGYKRSTDFKEIKNVG